jgi:hypothetical protein
LMHCQRVFYRCQNGLKPIGCHVDHYNLLMGVSNNSALALPCLLPL